MVPKPSKKMEGFTLDRTPLQGEDEHWKYIIHMHILIGQLFLFDPSPPSCCSNIASG